MAKPPAKSARKLTRRQFVQMAVAHGATEAKPVNPRDIVTGRWVQWKCRYGCGGYGGSLVCPPHTPTSGQTRQMLREYQLAILFECRDGRTKRVAASLERELFLAGYYRAFGMGGGPCELCEACGFENGCRHPHQARPAMEACGIDVFETVRRHGFKVDVVRSHQDPQHYFGLVLVK